MDEIMKTRKFQTALLRGSRAACQMRELKNSIDHFNIILYTYGSINHNKIIVGG